MTAPVVSGRTRWYAVLGDPVAQVRAPGLLNPLLTRFGVDAIVLPVHAPVRYVADVVRGLTRVDNLDGMLVTVPHKAAVCALADSLGPAAKLSGTANAIRREPDGRWLAENFDGLGFVRGLDAAGHSVHGKRIVLVGGGGAGSAIAVALLMHGAAQVSVRDPDRHRLTALTSRLNSRWPGSAGITAAGDFESADFVVNATPLGLRPDDPLPFDPSTARRDAVVVDIIMNPHETALLREAERLGRTVHHGIHMLEEQVPCYREFFGWP